MRAVSGGAGQTMGVVATGEAGLVRLQPTNSKEIKTPKPCRRRRKENPNPATEWHDSDELARVILECGGNPESVCWQSLIALHASRPTTRVSLGHSWLVFESV